MYTLLTLLRFSVYVSYFLIHVQFWNLTDVVGELFPWFRNVTDTEI